MVKIGLKEHNKDLTVKKLDVEKGVESIYNQLKSLIGSGNIYPLSSIFLPDNIYMFVELNKDKEINAMGLRSTIVFVKIIDDKYVDISKNNIDFISKIMFHKNVEKKYLSVSEDFYAPLNKSIDS